jgi:hypothetical protein
MRAAVATLLLLLAIGLCGCDTRAMNQPDAFGVRFQNDLGGLMSLALCNNDRCDSPSYSREVAAGGTDEENISPDLETEWAVEAPDGILLRCVVLYWKYAPSHTPTIRLSTAPRWSSPCGRRTAALG